MPAPPATLDYTLAGALSFPMDGNDTYGDCEYAAACHASNSMTGCAAGSASGEDSFVESAIVARYLQLSGGDNGLATDTMMTEWLGGIVGPNGPHTILDQMAVDPTDQAAMQLALYLFGGVFFTLAVPDVWVDNATGGAVWTSGTGVVADDNNGHAVWFTGYNATGYQLQTWALQPPITITPAGVAVCDPEATVVFSLDFFNAQGIAPNGLTYATLASLWQQLGGKALPPFPTPAPSPTPTPTPAPPPPPPPPLPPVPPIPTPTPTPPKPTPPPRPTPPRPIPVVGEPATVQALGTNGNVLQTWTLAPGVTMQQVANAVRQLRQAQPGKTPAVKPPMGRRRF